MTRATHRLTPCTGLAGQLEHKVRTMSTHRSVDHLYRDPVDLIWLHTAQTLGLTVVRSSEVFASWDGKGTLAIGTDDSLDEDDCLAQMILHELCHALIQGDEAHALPDWGLDNTDPTDATREHATLRLQAALLTPHGLRRILAVTTDWRADYDALPEDPLLGDDDATLLAQEGWRRATTGPWATPLQRALQATAHIATATAPFARGRSLWGLISTDKKP